MVPNSVIAPRFNDNCVVDARSIKWTVDVDSLFHINFNLATIKAKCCAWIDLGKRAEALRIGTGAFSIIVISTIVEEFFYNVD